METEVVEQQIAEVNSALAEPNSVEEYRDLEVFLDFLMDMKKAIGDTFDPIIKKAHETHKEACAQKNKFEKPRQYAEDRCRSFMAAFLVKEERRKRQLADEQTARMRAEVQERAAMEEDPEERAKLEQDAQDVRATVDVVAPGELTSSVPKWEAEVVSIKELCAAIAAGTVPEEAVTPNQTFLNRAAGTFKDQGRWPGVRFVQTIVPKRKRR